MTQGLIAQGVGAANLVRIVASLHDRLSRRVIALQLAGEPAAPGEFCWISLGSEGRQDRTLASDQDNGIIFPEGADAIATRERLLPVAGRINRALAQVGFPECPGFIMASNPKWCLSLSEWRAEFSHWISVGDPEAVLKANIFFDFRPLYGDAAPAQALREWLVEAVKGNSRFLRLMSENALANTPPLGLLRDFEVAGDDSAHPGTIDLKMRGATVFTDCARIYALAHGVEVTNTSRRLLEVSDRGAFPRADAEAWVAAIDFLQHFRLRHQHARLARGEKPDNYLRPEHLNDLDRRLLKECLRSARRLQQRVALDYGL
jgi:CBS domain-containing protein